VRSGHSGTVLAKHHRSYHSGTPLRARVLSLLRVDFATVFGSCKFGSARPIPFSMIKKDTDQTTNVVGI